MLLTCWSAKGGSGTTTVAVSLALLLARRSETGAVLLDLAGDAAAALGVRSAGPGVSDWLAAGDDVSPGALRRLEIEVGPGFAVVPFGETELPIGPSSGSAARLLAGVDALGGDGRPVIVDAGTPRVDGLAAEVVKVSTSSLLVARPCYLGLRRAVASPLRATGIVLVDENERALGVADIEEAVGAPVVAVVPTRPEIARAVDSGMLAGRLPRVLASSLRRAA